jgi:hypothetical protein
MAYVNIKQVISEINTSSRKQLENLAYGAARSKFNNSKEELIEEFENHPASVEIKAGPEAGSEFLSRGNLFSALGFNVGSNPVKKVSDYIDDNLELTRSVETHVIPERLTFNYKFLVNTPSLREIKEQADLEWTSRNWIDEVEQGISDLTLYIYHRFFSSDHSRSTTGLQSKNKKTGGTVYRAPSSYFTELWTKFKDRIRR